MRRKATANAPAYFALAAIGLFACGPTAPATGPAGPRPPTAPEPAGPDAGAPKPADEQTPVEQTTGVGKNTGEAIQVCKPSGETAYLSRLRCTDGSAPSYQRVGHGGYRSPRNGPDDYRRSADQVRTARPLEDGETDFHPVDQYTLLCTGEEIVHKLYLDMYHCGPDEQTAEPPDGFTIVRPPPPPASAVQPGG